MPSPASSLFRPPPSLPTATPATTTQVRPEHDASGSLAPGYFERLYAEHGDPWSFATSPYEAAKYHASLQALPHPRYRNAIEIGCAIGVFTRRLARRCDRLLALDVSEAALKQARVRCRRPGVSFERRSVPAEMPDGPFDLVVLSEVGYYWSEADLAAAGDAFRREASPGAHLLLVHYTGTTNYPLSAERVHDAFCTDPAWRTLCTTRHAAYRLDVLERKGCPPSTECGSGGDLR